MKRSESLEFRLLSSVARDKKTGCWLWQRATNKGYGLIRVDGVMQRVHRVSFALYCRSISPDEVVRHTCDNPTCMNPTHLIGGTQTQNIADRDQRKRQARGSRHGQSKLKSQEVVAIIAAHAEGESYSALGRRYSVHHTVIRDVVLGNSWV